jgi:ribosomal protein S27AE
MDFPPVGGTKRFLVKCDGNPYVSYDMIKEAEGYVTMQKECPKGGKGNVLAYCAMRNWTIEDRG